MFGMRPVAFNAFDMTPRLPKEWNRMALRNIHSFGNVFDLEVERSAKNKLKITVTRGGKKKTYSIIDGEKIRISLD
jgi:hypothetical protein